MIHDGEVIVDMLTGPREFELAEVVKDAGHGRSLAS